MNTLKEIAETYQTDKNFFHNYYHRAYDEALLPLKETATKVCEIGICGQNPAVNWVNGNSLRIWRDYFTNANILGLDIDPFDNVLGDRVTIDFIDQSSREQVIEYSTKLSDYDLIVDDGSHKMYDQQITFAYFFKSLRSGGIFILEDLHTSYEVKIAEKNNNYLWGTPDKITTLEMLEKYNETGKIHSDYLTPEECGYLESNINSIKIYDDVNHSVTSVIYKK